MDQTIIHTGDAYNNVLRITNEELFMSKLVLSADMMVEEDFLFIKGQ